MASNAETSSIAGGAGARAAAATRQRETRAPVFMPPGSAQIGDMHAWRGLLIAYERSKRGRAALMYGAQVARACGIPRTVISVTPQERSDVGCASCRQSAILWNVVMADLARENLLEAGRLLEPPGLGPIDYVIGRGDPAASIAAAATQAKADLIVVPWERPRTLGLFRHRTLAARLGADPALTVRSGPSTPTRTRPRNAADQLAATEPAASERQDWRRLGYALAFFSACLAVIVGLFAIGFYH